MNLLGLVKLKIIFLNRFFYPDHSATSQMLADLAFALAEVGGDIDVVTSRLTYDNPNSGLPSYEVISNVRVHRVWTSRFGRSWLPGRALDYLSFYVTAGWKVFRLSSKGDVIVAKTDPPLISVVAWLVARYRGAKLINWLQDLFPEVADALGIKLAQGKLGNFLARLRNISLRQAEFNVVLGNRMAYRLQGLGIKAERIAIIHNWADGQAIRPLTPDKNALLQSWGLKDYFVVVYSGNMGRAHEFETFLNAAEYLHSKGHSSVKFVLIGGGYWYSWIERKISERGLTNVMIKPYLPRDQLPLSLSMANVHLVSLLPVVEGCIVPSKIYGILAAGCPVVFVGDGNGEVAQLIKQAECGETVNIGNGSGLAQAILRLRDNPTLALTWGANARQAFESKYTMTLAVDAWRKLVFNNN